MWWEIPKHLVVKNHKLYIGQKEAFQLAQKHGTPLYVLNIERVKDNYWRFYNAFQKNLNRKLKIHYAIKANSSIALLKALNKWRAFLDTVSPYEVLAAELAGFSPEKVLFTGTSVSDEDMKIIAKKAKINIDSFSQLERYSKLVEKYNFSPEISIRINPGKGAGHVPECVTAGTDAKYGIPDNQTLEAFEKAIKLGLKPIGIHQHLGSQILEPAIDVFYKATEKILNIAFLIKTKINLNLKFIDLGGGIGIPYKLTECPVNINSAAKKIAKIIESKAKKYNLGNFDLYLEPGRYIVGDAEILLIKAVDIGQKFLPELGVNAGFNVFARPSRYKAYHEIINVLKADLKGEKKYRISGNLCESGDVFTESKTSLRKLPITKEGDVLAILNAGAYGYVMASNYNLRPRPREIMVQKRKVKIIREGESFKDLLKKQIY